MRVQDLITAAAKCRVVTRFRSTIGLPGRLATRLQPNHPTDDLKGIAASVLDGLSYGNGDAVIGVNPASDNVATCEALLHILDAIRERYAIPTQICVLAHVTTQMEAMRRGAPVDLVFQSIAGTEAANRSFGVSIAMLDEAVDVPTSHQPCCDGIFRNRMIEPRVERLIEHRAGETLEPPALPPRLYAVHGVGFGPLQRRVEIDEPFRLLFEIDIDKKYELAARMLQPRHHCFVVAEIPREIEHSHVHVAFVQSDRLFTRIVWRPVIDEQQLVVVRHCGGGSGSTAIELLDVLRRFVECGDNRELHCVTAGLPARTRYCAAAGPTLKSRSRTLT
jgi:hypothetical protein